MLIKINKQTNKQKKSSMNANEVVDKNNRINKQINPLLLACHPYG